jgi:hypothetical protein
VIVTFAPGTTAWLASVTVPRIVAVDRCARVGGASRTKEAVNSSQRVRMAWPTFVVGWEAESLAPVRRDVNSNTGSRQSRITD